MSAKCICRLAALWLSISASVPLSAQSIAFTYQGRLVANGAPANGTYDLRFVLTDAASGGNSLGGPVTNAPVGVNSGLFMLPLNFGGSAFDGSMRWLEIGVRTNGSTNAYTTLSPRQPITAAPYALFASAAASASIASNLVGGGSQLTNVPASSLSGTVPLSRLSGITPAQIDPATWQAATNNTTLTDLHVRSTGGNFNGADYGWMDATNGTLALPGWMFGDSEPVNPGGQGVAFYGTNGVRVSAIQSIHSHSGVNLAELVLDSRAGIHLRPSALFGGNGNLGYIFLGHSGGADYAAMQYGNYDAWRSPGSTDNLTTYPFGHSQPLFFAAQGTNAAAGAAVYASPGIIGVASTNRTYAGASYDAAGELWFFDHVPEAFQRNPTLYGGGGRRMGRMRTNGWEFLGSIILQRATVTSTNTCPLDFALAQCVDITCGSPSVSFYSTNAWGFATNFEERTFIIRSGGLARTLTWPAWSVLGASMGTTLPASLSPGQMIELKLKSVGVGESNKIATFSQGAGL